MSEPVFSVSSAPSAGVPMDIGRATTSPKAAGGELLNALGIGAPVGVPLREVAGAVAGELGRGADPVAAARLEAATLDFAREAKAFAIGNAAMGQDAVRGVLEAALDAGTAQADRLHPILTGVSDRVTAVFEGAAAHLRQN